VLIDDAMIQTYDKLATQLINRYQKDLSSNKLLNNQLFVCVAGGPGSGKSTCEWLFFFHLRRYYILYLHISFLVSAAVAQRINEQMNGAAVVIPMDGYHYSRAELQRKGESTEIEYTYDQLLARRGAPWTFDAEGCVDAFKKARQDGKASLPIYSRIKSDPINDGVQLCFETKIVLLEGNYLLAWDDKRWAPLKGIFDETWYIECKSINDQRERLVRRHLETWSDAKTQMFGEGEEGAGRKADSNDMLNLVWIQEKSKHHADYVIESL